MSGKRIYQSLRSVRTAPLGLLAFLLCVGCDARLGSQAPPDPESGDGGPNSPGTIGVDDIPAPGTRFRRLTHDQWQKTTSTLLGVESDSPLSEVIAARGGAFLADPRQGGYLFDGYGDALSVDSFLYTAYQSAAADIAGVVVADAALLSSLLPPGSDDEARVRAFITSFGERVHRRPLTEAQEEAYFLVFEKGTTAYPDTVGFRGGIRLLLEGFLQSPHYLYRVEESAEEAGGMIALDGFERASRLSYFFWNTMPDEALFQAAKSGDLESAEGIKAEARRLAQDSRAKETVIAFFEKLLELERYNLISPSPSRFPDVSPDLPEAAHSETITFIGEEIFEKNGGVSDLLTSTQTYVNNVLAPIYGLSDSFDETFQAAQLDPTERSGIFTQIGFLASHATSSEPDPIHRGVFLAKRINCLDLSAPPDEVPELPVPSGQSNRQLVEEHTEAEGSTCRNCHSTIINPFGFAYEHYDAIGSYRTEDRTHPVDASSEVPLDGGRKFIENAVDLAAAMAQSPQVHECISSHLIAYAQGRDAVEEDTALVNTLGESSLGGLSLTDLMVELAAADSFTHLAVEDSL